MMRTIGFAAAAIGGVIVTAACASGVYGSGAAYGTPAAAPSGAPSATIAVESTPLGQILVDGSGRPVYLFEADRGTTSTCYDSCAAVWPPVLTSGAPHAGPGVNQELLATTTRSDGTLEVLYHGHPLYYFVSDKSGQATGQGLSSFGAVWYVLSPAGDKVDKG
jgi:predicted lipoprotein with Yx(FWY)xxD motif